MRSFAEIVAQAAERKGSAAKLDEILAATAPRTRREIAATPDDRILAEMTRRIFYAGFSSKVIDDKWPAFEKGFDGFDPNACGFMSEAHFDSLTQDRGIVRNGAKIRWVQINAQFLLALTGCGNSPSGANDSLIRCGRQQLAVWACAEQTRRPGLCSVT
jgi:3-methyladenine DNA glycosylase Tag